MGFHSAGFEAVHVLEQVEWALGDFSGVNGLLCFCDAAWQGAEKPGVYRDEPFLMTFGHFGLLWLRRHP